MEVSSIVVQASACTCSQTGRLHHMCTLDFGCAKPTTSPTTITAGGRIFCCSITSATVPSVQRTVSWSGQLARRTMATGVSGDRPPREQGLAPLPRGCHAHVKNQRAGELGQTAGSPTPGRGLSPRRWPVIRATAEARSRCVRGMPAWLATAKAAVTPGHDFVGNARRGEDLDLFAPAAEKIRIAALEANDLACPGWAAATMRRLTSCWSISRPPCGWPRQTFSAADGTCSSKAD